MDKIYGAMEFNITIWSFILFLGSLQGLVIIMALALGGNLNKKRNIIFAALTLAFSLIMFDHGLRLSNLYKAIPNLIYISDGIWYLIAPLIYFYSLFLINPSRKFQLIDLLHLIPFIIMQAWYFPLLFADAEIKIQILEHYNIQGSYNLLTNLTILAMMVQILAYLVAAYSSIKKYEIQYRERFSDNQIVYLRRTRMVLLIFIVYFLLEFSFSSFRNFLGYQNEFFDRWSLTVWVFFIYSLATILLSNPSVLFSEIKISETYSGPMDQENGQKEISKLLSLLNSDKPFTKVDLSLPELAESLDVRTNHLSFLINKKLGMNFYELINSYRAREAKKMLSDPGFAHLSIQGIAEKAGFKSKSSFYRFFKKEFHKTPKEYLRLQPQNQKVPVLKESK